MEAGFMKQYTLLFYSDLLHFYNVDHKFLSWFHNPLMDLNLDFEKHQCTKTSYLKDEQLSLS